MAVVYICTVWFPFIHTQLVVFKQMFQLQMQVFCCLFVFLFLYSWAQWRRSGGLLMWERFMEVSKTDSKTFLLTCLLLLYTTHMYNSQYTILTVPMNTCCPLQNMPYLVANVDCTHVGLATASVKDLVTLHKSSWPGAELCMGRYRETHTHKIFKMNFTIFYTSMFFVGFFCGRGRGGGGKGFWSAILKSNQYKEIRNTNILPETYTYVTYMDHK